MKLSNILKLKKKEGVCEEKLGKSPSFSKGELDVLKNNLGKVVELCYINQDYRRKEIGNLVCIFNRGICIGDYDNKTKQGGFHHASYYIIDSNGRLDAIKSIKVHNPGDYIYLNEKIDFDYNEAELINHLAKEEG